MKEFMFMIVLFVSFANFEMFSTLKKTVNPTISSSFSLASAQSSVFGKGGIVD